MAELRFTVEFVLSTGDVIHEPITEDEVVSIVGRHAWVFRDGMPDDEKAYAALVSTIALALDGRFISATDADGRTWLIPSSNVVAVSIMDERDRQATVPPPRRPIGFTPPLVDRVSSVGP